MVSLRYLGYAISREADDDPGGNYIEASVSVINRMAKMIETTVIIEVAIAASTTGAT